MKKLIYLFVATIMFVFTACGGGDNSTEETAVDSIIQCADNCEKACCLGCKATQGNAKCIVLADGSMPCCVEELESSEDDGHNQEDDGYNHDH